MAKVSSPNHEDQWAFVEWARPGIKSTIYPLGILTLQENTMIQTEKIEENQLKHSAKTEEKRKRQASIRTAQVTRLYILCGDKYMRTPARPTPFFDYYCQSKLNTQLFPSFRPRSSVLCQCQKKLNRREYSKTTNLIFLIRVAKGHRRP